MAISDGERYIACPAHAPNNVHDAHVHVRDDETRATLLEQSRRFSIDALPRVRYEGNGNHE